jgi:hypothetical protein
MAKTYSAIQSFTLTSTTASVVFNNIPQNFSDLLIKVSSRKIGSGVDTEGITINGSALSYGRYMDSNGSNGATPRSGNVTIYQGLAQPSDYTASTFSVTEYFIPGYTNSYYKTITGNSILENNGAATYQGRTASIYNSTSAVTSLTLTVNGSNYAANSTFTLYGIGTGAKASGGTVTGTGNYVVHTFTSSSTFIPTENIKNAEVLVVAGGGGGGCGRDTAGLGTYGAGGGGAGGLLAGTLLSTLNAGTSYTVTVGAGGAGGSGGTPTTNQGVTGNNSQLGALIANGGGGAGGTSSNATYKNGLSGGSGGGPAMWSTGSGTAGSATQTNLLGVVGYGNAGGVGLLSNEAGGGGGGAGGVGGTATSSNGGDGGAPFFSSINGIYTSYAGGGGAGAISGRGGYGGGSANANLKGGGGDGVLEAATVGGAGTANTGGGGGSAGGNNAGGAGGSGIVIIRYPVN